MLLLLSTSIFLFLSVACGQLNSSLDYGMVMDAGSSGTRIYIYCWSRRETSVDTSDIDSDGTISFSVPESRPSEIGSCMLIVAVLCLFYFDGYLFNFTCSFLVAK